MPALPFLAAAFQQWIGDCDGSPAAEGEQPALVECLWLEHPGPYLRGPRWRGAGVPMEETEGRWVGERPLTSFLQLPSGWAAWSKGRMWKQGWLRSGSQGSPAFNRRWVIGCGAAVLPQAHLLLLCSVWSLSCLEGASKRLVALLLGHF